MSEETNLLTDAEMQLLQAIDVNDVSSVKQHLTEVKNVNILDENFMSPLQYAAYRGNREILQLLLDHGADVNFCEHKHNYTALHFAGLSGNMEACAVLLAAGAKPLEINTVGRTPAQMAAFVGNHSCVAVINNYVPKSEVDYYTVPHGTQTKELLPAFLADSFHKFIMQVNVHPVRIALNVQDFVGLRDNLGAVREVLELMSKREMQRKERNEVIAFKYHLLGYVVRELAKIKERKDEEKSQEKKFDPVELFSKKLLRPGKDGNFDFMDSFLKECVREFPHRECTIFRQMVATLAGKDPPPALRVIGAAINGQRGFVDAEPACSSCGEEKPAKKCSKCKVVQYCDRNCQRLHWAVHKKACTRLSQVPLEGCQKEQVQPDVAEVSAELQNLLVN